MISRQSSLEMSGIAGSLGRSSKSVKASNSNLMASDEKTESASEAMGLNSESMDARSTCTSCNFFTIPSLHPVVGTSDGRDDTAPVNAVSQPGRMCSPRDVAFVALDAIALFGLIFAGFWIGAGLGWL